MPWQLDWTVRMLVPPGRPLAGMAFHRVHGVTWSPMPGWPHEDPTERVLHRPSTAATLHVCAVAAQGARVFAAQDPPYAQRLLAVARTAHAAANAQPTLVAPDDHGRFGGAPYPDDRLDDDFYWAAAELWLTTGEQPFLDEVTASPNMSRTCSTRWASTSTPWPARRGSTSPSCRARCPTTPRVRASVVEAAERLSRLQADQPWGQLTPRRQAGTGDPTAASSTSSSSSPPPTRSPATVGSTTQLPRGWTTCSAATRSARATSRGKGPTPAAISGRGSSPTTSTPPSRSRPPGALAGGANSRDHPGFPTDPRLACLPPQRCYLDEPTSETTNDVCIRWNAPLAYVARYLTM